MKDSYESLLREAVKIIHANSRNMNKDWLQRARAKLKEGQEIPVSKGKRDVA